ncbi:alpha-1,2-mannosidase [Clostridium saccharobutylicum]|uniref:alpha-1,2-mannosidase n=1 Tax=Clostridium saccharobutylicum TaxID=169679 RepID=UPI001F4BE598|nr:alpha-1,2-mannosidase [Clostridium saccharobutylicum]NOV74422.1 hypothetical protein [Clostridium saccharobutylicum]
MSYKNNESKVNTSYTKCAGFGFCACCNESVCTVNELNNSKSIETFHDDINKKLKIFKVEKIKLLTLRMK